MMSVPTAEFEQWVRDVFDHPVAEPEWYWGSDYSGPPPRIATAFLTRLFQEPEAAFTNCSDDQIAVGLNFICSPSCSNYGFAPLDEDVPLGERLACLRSIGDLFEKLFARRCSSHLGHLDEGGGRLNQVCYMWWDIFPWYGQPENLKRKEIDSTGLEVLKRILWLPSDACREATFHGLSHNCCAYPEQVKSIISRFLEVTQEIRLELFIYAQKAIVGGVQ